ncbi:unnamed protein product [Urochloa humidicola]
MAGRREGEHQESPWRSGTPEAVGDSGRIPSIVVFAVGAAATYAAKLRRSDPYVYWEDIPRAQRPNRCGEAWEQYYQRMRERNEDQSERVERIRRMQDVFKKERSKCRDYRSWEGYNPNNHQYEYSQRNDWYSDAEAFYANQRTNFRSMPRETMSYAMSRHYSILGLDGSRSEPFSDAEIKDAFRRKAMKYHPDQNQNNKEAAEAKFKEVMDSYEAIKSERRNGSC